MLLLLILGGIPNVKKSKWGKHWPMCQVRSEWTSLGNPLKPTPILPQAEGQCSAVQHWHYFPNRFTANLLQSLSLWEAVWNAGWERRWGTHDPAWPGGPAPHWPHNTPPLFITSSSVLSWGSCDSGTTPGTTGSTCGEISEWTRKLFFLVVKIVYFGAKRLFLAEENWAKKWQISCMVPCGSVELYSGSGWGFG